MNEELDREVADLRSRLEESEVRNKFLTSQVHQLEGLLESKRQVTDAKEQMIMRLQDEYTQIMADYQRTLDLNGVQTGQLRQAKVQIAELESELAEFRFPSKAQTVEFAIPPPGRDDFSPMARSYEMPKVEPEPVDEFQFVPPVPRTPVRKAALVDNICFGEESRDLVCEDCDSMTVSEMREMLANLRRDKDELERKLNKAAPRGRLMAHVRQEREESEAELETLVRRIAKLRYSLRKMNQL
jgi:hypothetical protein